MYGLKWEGRSQYKKGSSVRLGSRSGKERGKGREEASGRRRRVKGGERRERERKRERG